MPIVKNISGEDLDVPLLRRLVKAGEEVEVEAEHVDSTVRLWAASHWHIDGKPQALPDGQVHPEPLVHADPDGAAPAAAIPVEVPEPVSPEIPAANPVTE